VLRLTLDLPSQDRQARYGRPVAVVKACVDPDQFGGAGFSASGWIELGD
jgi:hypothetical protein